MQGFRLTINSVWQSLDFFNESKWSQDNLLNNKLNLNFYIFGCRLDLLTAHCANHTWFIIYSTKYSIEKADILSMFCTITTSTQLQIFRIFINNLNTKMTHPINYPKQLLIFCLPRSKEFMHWFCLIHLQVYLLAPSTWECPGFWLICRLCHSFFHLNERNTSLRA